MISNVLRINNDFPSYIEAAPRSIYRILNIINGCFYIGSAFNYKNRWSHHIHLLNKNKHDNIHLQRAWNKYGSKNFIFSIIIQIFNKNNLHEIEQQYLDKYFKIYKDKLYNIAKKVEGHSNGLNMIGENNINAKLTKNQVHEIRTFNFNDQLKTEVYKQLAIKYNVSELTISRIIRNKQWKND
ncbi:MAG: GIY-YIG nuclease family protein [Candidatus Paceibacterota bacterium]|jgi:group I intron endonuclease